jgi:hypothetical protein
MHIIIKRAFLALSSCESALLRQGSESQLLCFESASEDKFCFYWHQGPILLSLPARDLRVLNFLLQMVVFLLNSKIFFQPFSICLGQRFRMLIQVLCLQEVPSDPLRTLSSFLFLLWREKLI